jgi:hypothetical protein
VGPTGFVGGRVGARRLPALEQGQVLRRLRISHDVAGVDRLVRAIDELEPEAGRVPVAIETGHGLLVSAPLDAG